MEEKRKLLREYLETIIEVDFEDSDNLFALRLVNSLFAVKMVKFLEQTFSMTIEGDELDITNFCSIDAIMEFIRKKNR